uniref:Uncharacterized protein n=1 Tax=Oryza punctata TaxID=4537 RepID=A0A0E0KWH1_ORYPU
MVSRPRLITGNGRGGSGGTPLCWLAMYKLPATAGMPLFYLLRRAENRQTQDRSLHCTATSENTGCLQHSTDSQEFIGSAESAAAERLKAAWHIANWAAGKSPAHRPSWIGQINIGAFRAILSRSRQLAPPHLAYAHTTQQLLLTYLVVVHA